MKSVKIVFGFASIALLLAVGCFLAFLFLPGNMTEKNDVREEDSFVSMEPLTAEEQAKIEIERFRTDYGCEITMDEMLLQLKIRAEYEETYHMSYPLEEVFLAEEDKDLSFGDAGDVSYTDTIEKIQKYIEMYNIDESRYASMTAEEELHALEIEYGPLDFSENGKSDEYLLKKSEPREEQIENANPEDDF